MDNFPVKLSKKIDERKAENAFRSLGFSKGLADFSSNDYLGMARNEGVYSWAGQLVSDRDMVRNGATGSRLLTGNHCLFDSLENMLERLHQGNVLVFNSGYDANLGFFASVPQRGDIVLYDEASHASIRDGIKLGLAKAYKFRHNNLEDLRIRIQRLRNSAAEIYVVTESVFSMDGDSPDFRHLIEICEEFNCRLVADEAHALGVLAADGKGWLQELDLHRKCFARIITFGKALGAHGAAIVGDAALKEYLVNFARSFIYSTALPPHAAATLLAAHHFLVTPGGRQKQAELRKNIEFFKQQVNELGLAGEFIPSDSAIHCCTLPGNNRVKEASAYLRDNGYDVRPILSPTVPRGSERLRFCLHSYNSRSEVNQVLELLHKFFA